MVHHLGVTPRYLLRYVKVEERRRIIVWSGTDRELTSRLMEDAARDIVYPIGRCDKWDDHKGCPGHGSINEI